MTIFTSFITFAVAFFHPLRVSLARTPVLSFARYFQAPATQATSSKAIRVNFTFMKKFGEMHFFFVVEYVKSPVVIFSLCRNINAILKYI